MTDARVNQDTLNAAVRAAGDAFRGAVDPSLCKDHLLAMFFLKCISDAWVDHYQQYEKEHGAHPELIEEMLKNERFVLPHGASFHSLYALRHEPGNGERIDKALQAIEECNLAKLRGVFQDIGFNSSKLGEEAHKNDILRRLLEDFNKPELNLRPSRIGTLDVIGNACDFLIENFTSGSGKKSGEFHTPPEISTLMALLVDPRPGDDIGDPTCGSGSLLMKCGQLIRSRTGSRKYALYGQEAMGSTWALAKMNLFLHGEDNHRVEWGDTLRNPKLIDIDGLLKRFDVVVANPPFSLDTWDREAAEADRFKRYRRGLPPRTKADYAFILHMVETMKTGTGRMAVVVPHGVLFRGAAEGKIRRQLINENLLDAVIGLPEKLFHGTGIPAAILVFRKNKVDDKVLFVDASREYLDGKNQNVLRAQDLDKVMATCAARRSVRRYAHLAGPSEIAENDYNLHIARYVDGFEEKEEIDLPALRAQRVKLNAELATLEEKMAQYLKELGYE
ncbi:MAG: type restriction-modification system subunit [Rhizobacter sp.]|nr:type restriction-modification system subunit [Rhizobacter sp.]